MLKIVLATRNRKKVDELSRMFSGIPVQFVTLDSFPGCPEVVEDGKTFRANAVKKAREVAKFTGCPAVSDDSGLEVKALGGAPGVLSARYAGEQANDQTNVSKLLKELRKAGDSPRDARFVCWIALALPDGKIKTFSGEVRGQIGEKAQGFNGFGYDPVFRPIGEKRTFAEMSNLEKDAISHRGRAMRKLYIYLRNLF